MHRPSLNNSLHPTWRPLPVARLEQLSKETAELVIPQIRREIVKRNEAINKELKQVSLTPEQKHKLETEQRDLIKRSNVLESIESDNDEIFIDIDGEFTTCTIIVDSDTQYIGVSRKSKKDKPNVNLGIRLALQRAISKATRGSYNDGTKDRQACAFKVTHLKKEIAF